MKTTQTFFHCGDQLRRTLADEIREIDSVLCNIQWAASFQIEQNGGIHEHQSAYNKAFSEQSRVAPSMRVLGCKLSYQYYRGEFHDAQ
jgi:hypothetical protein